MVSPLLQESTDRHAERLGEALHHTEGRLLTCPLNSDDVHTTDARSLGELGLSHPTFKPKHLESLCHTTQWAHSNFLVTLTSRGARSLLYHRVGAGDPRHC